MSLLSLNSVADDMFLQVTQRTLRFWLSSKTSQTCKQSKNTANNFYFGKKSQDHQTKCLGRITLRTYAPRKIGTGYHITTHGHDGDVLPHEKCASNYDWDMLPHDKSWKWLGRILPHEKIRIKIWLGRVTPWKVMNMRGTYYPLKKYATKYDWDVLRHGTSCDKYAWTEKMWA